MGPVRHVIFDLDGTLIDSLPGIEWSVAAALASCGLPPLSRDLKPLIGPPIRSILSTVSGISEPAQLGELEEAFRSSYDSAGWRKTRCQDGAADLLEQLFTGGIDLWVVTNKPARVTHRILDDLKLTSFFQEVACRMPWFHSKHEVLEDLLQRRALHRPACLMVGDTFEDYDAARAAGIECALVPHGYGTALEGRRYVSGWEEIAALCDVAVYATEGY